MSAPMFPWSRSPLRVVSLFDMLKRYAFNFYELITNIEQLRRLAETYAIGGFGRAIKLYPQNFDGLTAILTDARAECDKLDLTSTGEFLSHVKAQLASKGENYTYADLLNHMESLRHLFATELRRNSCFRIASEKDKYFEKTDLFGPEVSEAFGSCIAEIQNAGTCYALEQNDACVFHLMRVLERGLGALASKFAVPFANDNWHNIIEQLESKIRKMDSSFSPDWKTKQKFYAGAASQFMFLKDAWRNHVIHGRDLFDEGKAHSVLDHVRGFMQALAEGGLTE